MPRNAAPSRSRGCGRAMGISEQTRPGLDDRTRIRSHMSTASSMLCVTKQHRLQGKLRGLSKDRENRSRRVSAVSTSSAEKGSSISSATGSADERAGKSHALAHAARELARIGRLESHRARSDRSRPRRADPLSRARAAAHRGPLDVLETVSHG